MIRDILSIRRGECRYCLTDDTPFFFCGDPVAEDSSYCPEHHALCYRGFGRDVGLLESMMHSKERTVVRKSLAKPHVVAVDSYVRSRG